MNLYQSKWNSLSAWSTPKWKRVVDFWLQPSVFLEIMSQKTFPQQSSGRRAIWLYLGNHTHAFLSQLEMEYISLFSTLATFSSIFHLQIISHFTSSAIKVLPWAGWSGLVTRWVHNNPSSWQSQQGLTLSPWQGYSMDKGLHVSVLSYEKVVWARILFRSYGLRLYLCFSAGRQKGKHLNLH